MQQGSHRFSLRCRLTKPFLGNRRHKDVRRFDMRREGGSDYFYPDTVMWRWALTEALDSIGALEEVDVDYVRLPTKLQAPAIRLYTRIRDTKNPDKREMFESFQTGAVITIPLFILHTLEPAGLNQIRIAQRPPTVEEITESFRIIGSDIGLSPWGSKFGYGRFTVENE